MSEDSQADRHFQYEPDPDHPGWSTWALRDPTRYNALLGKMLVRQDGDLACVRMFPQHQHSNLADIVHGAVTLGFIDCALFAAARVFGCIGDGPALTLDLSTQFIGPGQLDRPLDAEVELLRETRRLAFFRGIVHQEAEKVAAFAGTIRIQR
jgi:acyl-coenzyme A thioesterase PaaI-like protein